MTIPLGSASIPSKPPINSLCPVQVGVHTITVIVPDYWFVPGAHPWINGEFAIEGEPFFEIKNLNGNKKEAPARTWWAHTISYTLPKDRGQRVIRKWVITWHAPKIDGLMNEKTLFTEYIRILEKMHAPKDLISLEQQGYGIAKVVAIDIARDFDGISGAKEPTPAESRWHRRHHMIDIQKVCIPDFSEGETLFSAPETIYIQSPKRGVVECRYDKSRQLRQKHGFLLPTPRSRVELRLKTGQTCERYRVRTLPKACRYIRETRLAWQEEKRREKKAYLAELNAWRKETLIFRRIRKIRRRKNRTKTHHIVYSFTARLPFMRIRSRTKINGGDSYVHPLLLPEFRQTRGPPNSSFSTNYYDISARLNQGVLLVF